MELFSDCCGVPIIIEHQLDERCPQCKEICTAVQALVCDQTMIDHEWAHEDRKIGKIAELLYGDEHYACGDR